MSIASMSNVNSATDIYSRATAKTLVYLLCSFGQISSN